MRKVIAYNPFNNFHINCVKMNNNKIIYHDFLPRARMGSHVKSGKTHTVIKIHPLAHILDS